MIGYIENWKVTIHRKGCILKTNIGSCRSFEMVTKFVLAISRDAVQRIKYLVDFKLYVCHIFEFRISGSHQQPILKTR